MLTKSPIKNVAASLALLSSAVAGTLAVHAGTASVTTQHNDNMRTGANLSETILTPQNVNTKKFGKLFTIPLDSSVLGQVLYVPNVKINGATHNVIYAATGAAGGSGTTSPSSMYAFDADDPSGAQLWRLVLPPNAEWMTAAPVIDTSSGTIYFITKANSDSGDTLIHAVDMIAGTEKPGSPVTVAASVPGTGASSVSGMVPFDSSEQNSRPGLLLLNGSVYVGFSNAPDDRPYHGWVIGYSYDGTKFTQTGAFCDTPNGVAGGIWMSGNGLAADSAGNIYCMTGNGTFDINTGGTDYAMSAVKLSTPGLAVVDYFTPEEEPTYAHVDKDMDPQGLLLIPGQNRLFTGLSKWGSSYVLDTTNLGGFAPSSNQTNIVQALDGISLEEPYGFNPVCFDTGTLKYIYMWPGKNDLFQYSYDPNVGKISPASPLYTYNGTGGATLAVSANGSTNGILWSAQFSGALSAFDATNVTTRLWSSNENKSRDSLSPVVHFGSITVANGKLYVPTGDGQIGVYGLLSTTTTTTLDDIADSTVKAGANADDNYGSGTTFCIHRGGNNSTNASNRAAYFKFDLTNVTTKPKTAYLNLQMAANSIAGPSNATYNVYGSTASWTESGITWNNAPDLDRTDFSLTSRLITSQSVLVQQGPVQFDVTSYVRAHVGKVITLEIDDPNIDGNTMYGVTKEGNATLQPTLSLTNST